MFKIRQIKYSANAVSIQGFKIENGKRVIIRHIGNARNEQGKADLLTLVKDFIERITRQLNLFGNDQASNNLYLNIGAPSAGSGTSKRWASGTCRSRAGWQVAGIARRFHQNVQ